MRAFEMERLEWALHMAERRLEAESRRIGKKTTEVNLRATKHSRKGEK